MNMIGHPIKVDLPMLVHKATIISEERVHKLENGRISGDRLAAVLSMKTGLPLQYLLHFDKSLINEFGYTLQNLIQALAIEHGKQLGNSFDIPSGQLIVLIIETIQEKIDNKDSGLIFCKKRENITALMIASLGNGLCNIRTVRALANLLTQPNATELFVIIDKKVTNIYETVNLKSRMGMRYLLQLSQTNIGQTGRFLEEVFKELKKRNFLSRNISFSFGGDAKIWGWKYCNGSNIFVKLKDGESCNSLGCHPKNNGKYAWQVHQIIISNWGSFLRDTFNFADSAKDQERENIRVELEHLNDYVENCVETLNDAPVTTFLQSLRTDYITSGCAFFTTQLQGMSNLCRNLIFENSQLMQDHISHNDLLDRFVALQYHLFELTPEGIVGLTHEQLMQAGSCASSPSSDGNLSSPGVLFTQANFEQLQRGELAALKGKCARKLKLD